VTAGGAGADAVEALPATGSQPDAREFDRTTVSLMSAAHFVHDSYPAFVAVLLPLLIPKLGLTLAEAGLLASGIRWTTALQPILGFVADRTDARYWVIVAPATTAIFISLIGVAPGFLPVFVLLLLSGVSHAAFHPAAAAVATRAAGGRWGKGTSYFMTGGELGRALGPLFIAAVLTAVGLEWSWIALAPGVLFSFLLYHRVGRGTGIAFAGEPGSMRQSFARRRGPVLSLSVAIVLRSVANVGVVTFLPTLVVGRGGDLVLAGMAIAGYEIGGTAGAFVGGTLSDRFGRRSVLTVSLVAGLPALAAAVILPPSPLQLLVLAVAGFALLSAMPVQLVLMHELFPDNRSAATGITYFMTTAGAIAAMVAVGAMGDAIGLELGMLAGIAAGVAALPVILALPRVTAPHLADG
jgi:FSR family fosmidomycin resistance protein-like MFS transporter